MWGGLREVVLVGGCEKLLSPWGWTRGEHGDINLEAANTQYCPARAGGAKFEHLYGVNMKFPRRHRNMIL
jgi:hypothetical protein